MPSFEGPTSSESSHESLQETLKREIIAGDPLSEEASHSLEFIQGKLGESPNAEELVADSRVKEVVVELVDRILFFEDDGSQDEDGWVIKLFTLQKFFATEADSVSPEVREVIDTAIAVQTRERLQEWGDFSEKKNLVIKVLDPEDPLQLLPKTKESVSEWVVQLLGGDQMTQVLSDVLAHDTSLDRLVAMKGLHNFSEAFFQEAIRKQIVDRYDNFHVVCNGLEQSPNVRELLADSEIVSITTKCIERELLSREEELWGLEGESSWEWEELGEKGLEDKTRRLKQLLNLFSPEEEEGAIPSLAVRSIDRAVASRVGHTLSWLDASVMRELINPDAVSLRNMFPETTENLRQWLLQNLERNSHVAHGFAYVAVRNLDTYGDDPFVAACMEKAVTHYAAANKLFIGTGIFFKGYQPSVEKKARETLRGRDTLIKEVDPYEESPLRFGPKEAQTASLIANLLAGEPLPENVLHDKEGNPITNRVTYDESALETVKPFLETVSEKIDHAYSRFLENVEKDTHLREHDKVSLLTPDKSPVRMTPLLKTVRNLVARYLVQEAHLQLPSFSNLRHHERDIVREIDDVIRVGFEKFLQVHEVDIPLYDKLYEECATRREEEEDEPLHVYLGRDGIYSFYGDRALTVAYLRTLGREERERRKESGEVPYLEYLVYPRYYRDHSDEEALLSFLKEMEISEERNPFLIDTGLTGTIAKRIMRVLEFDEEKAEKRIRLLSTDRDDFRVEGIDEDLREIVVTFIEGNAKEEHTAEALFRDKKTGKLRHIAMPTSATEQFHFMMVRQAITRHYWLKTMLEEQESSSNK